MTNLTIGKSVTSIGDRAFYGCNGLTGVTCLATIPPSVSYYTFSSNNYNDAILYVPQVSVEAYRTAANWSRFTHIEGIGVVEPGDIDGDGEMNIKDVTDLIDMLLAGTINIENYPAADVNGDGSIDVADVTTLIDMLLASN